MKYFEVEEGRLSGNIIATPVASDGSYCGGGDMTEEKADALIWYRVWEFEEDGTTIDIKYYDINGSDSDSTLEQIKNDHPAGEWQNNDW